MRRAATTMLEGLRQLGRARGFALVAVLTLGIGVGAAGTIFTLVHSIVIRSLPYAGADRLVLIEHGAPGLSMTRVGQSDATYLHYREGSRVFESLAAYYENVVNLAGGGEAERVPVAMVTRDFFRTMGVQPQLGNTFRSENEPGVLISDALWRRRFGADPSIVGGMVELNGNRRTVIGVMPRGFEYPHRGVAVWYDAEPAVVESRFGDFGWQVVARMKPGVTTVEATTDIDRLIPTLWTAWTGTTESEIGKSGLFAVVTPLRAAIVGETGGALWLLMAGMILVLLIACANVANLFLVRAETRQREIVVRMALGAARADVVRYHLGQSAALCAGSSITGFVLTVAGTRAALAWGPGNLPRQDEIGIGAATVMFVVAAGAIAGLLAGCAPIFRRFHADLITTLKEGGRATSSREHQRARSMLVAAQVALALVLLIAASLMTQSLWHLRGTPPGFDARGVLTAEIALPFRGYDSYERATNFWTLLLDRTRALPGVTSAGAASVLPLSTHVARYDVPLVTDAENGTPMTATLQFVTPGYLESMGIPIESGTLFGESGPARAAASNALAREAFRDGVAPGRRIRSEQGSRHPWLEIGAVIADVPDRSVGDAGAPLLYVPLTPTPLDSGWVPSHMSLAVRTSTDPISLSGSLREIVAELDPALPVANVRTLARIVDDSMARTRFAMTLMMVAGAAALFLGAVGIFAVISFSVSRRTHEIGIRLALGAAPSNVQRMVLAQAARVSVAGLAAGAFLAAVLMPTLSPYLYRVDATDPATFAGMAGLLLLVSEIASWVPAARAARYDPLRALRQD